uniref:Uncharacterized protein n=1 Tax=Anguilla anguilla TaxID=7936 RepID=A0A0E9SSE2_ANGAN
MSNHVKLVYFQIATVTLCPGLLYH